MFDPEVIKEEIALHPEWEKLSDGAVLVELQSIKRRVRRKIPSVEVKALWSREFVLAACWVIANTPPPAGLNQEQTAAFQQGRIICFQTFYNLDKDLFRDLDLDDADQGPLIDKYLSGLIAAGALTEEMRTRTVALADIDVAIFAAAEQRDVWLARGQPEAADVATDAAVAVEAPVN